MEDLFRRDKRRSFGCCFGGGSGDADDSGASSDKIPSWFFHQAAAPPRPKKPRTNVDDEDDIKKIAKEMNELSFQERERVLEDIHGVAPLHEEHKEEIKAGLEAMDDVISLITKPNRKALDRALFLRPSIQDDVAFKLMFLRADLYDAHKAARRMVKYFEKKQELFGADKVAKDITLEDLDETERNYLNYIVAVVLPKRDPSGRPTLFCDMSKYDLDNPLGMYRCFWYQVMSELEDELVQMNGICFVPNCAEGVVTNSASLAKLAAMITNASGMVQSLPVRVVSDHFCYDDERLRFLVSAIRTAYGKSVRLRIRTHFGSPFEIQYSLMTFGIDCSDLLGHSGDDEENIRRKLQRDYIDKRRGIERQAAEDRAKKESASGLILCPANHDILVGRGRPYQEYCGNRWFAKYIDDYVEQFSRYMDGLEKSAVLMQVVKQVQELNGRFIQRTCAGWTVVSDTVARTKTASGLRSSKAKLGQRGGL